MSLPESPCVAAQMCASFYGGGPRERDILWRAYLRLVKHINSIYKVCVSFPSSISTDGRKVRFALPTSGQKIL